MAFARFGQTVIVFCAIEEEAEEQIGFAGFAWDADWGLLALFESTNHWNLCITVKFTGRGCLRKCIRYRSRK
jgi:hypothetical protein